MGKKSMYIKQWIVTIVLLGLKLQGQFQNIFLIKDYQESSCSFKDALNKEYISSNLYNKIMLTKRRKFLLKICIYLNYFVPVL